MAPDTAGSAGQDRITDSVAGMPRWRRLRARLLHPFFLAGEWWVRYTERIAAEQEARRG